jgi:hypothetical protein
MRVGGHDADDLDHGGRELPVAKGTENTRDRVELECLVLSIELTSEQWELARDGEEKNQDAHETVSGLEHAGPFYDIGPYVGRSRGRPPVNYVAVRTP